MERLPASIPLRQTETADFFLTHAIWCNSYGARVYETGVRRIIDGEVQLGFHLIMHNIPDTDFVEPIILKALRKGWDENRISDFLWNLHQRKRQYHS